MIDETNTVSSEELCSLLEEEQIKHFFQFCDKNGDGYIESIDLFGICKQLNLEYSLNEIMQGLGVDEHGRISYDEFLNRGRALKQEIEAFKNSEPHFSQDYQPSSSDTSADVASGAWDYDSGLSEPSREANSLQRLVEAAGGSVTTANAASLLHLANKLHLAAVESLHSQIADLTNKLTSVTEERDKLKLKIKKNESFQKTDILVQQYEEQITELHSIIAELKRKLEIKRTELIEEEECSDDLNEESNCDAEEVQELCTKVESDEKYLNDPANTISPILPAVKINEEYEEKIEIPNNSDIIKAATNKLEAEIMVLQLSITRIQSENEKLMLILGKYESNLIIIKLALEAAESILEYYEKLDHLCQTSHFADNRINESDIRLQIQSLKKKQKRLLETGVVFESYSGESSTLSCPKPSHTDFEVALLMQEMIEVREEKEELKRRLYLLHKKNISLHSQLHQMEVWHQNYIMPYMCQETFERDNSRKDDPKHVEIKGKLLKSLRKQIELTNQLKDINRTLMENMQKVKDNSRMKIFELQEVIQRLTEKNQSG